MRSAAGEPRHQVIELCELNLKLALAAARMPREDVQDELCPVDDAAIGGVFDVALLDGGKIAVENDQRRIPRSCLSANFVQFAAAHQRGRVGRVAKLKDRAGNLRACAARELGQFGQRFALRLPRRQPR